jgi:hypothetical protein
VLAGTLVLVLEPQRFSLSITADQPLSGGKCLPIPSRPSLQSGDRPSFELGGEG